MFQENTSGIFAGDLILKTAIELSLQDMREKPWLIEDCFQSLVENQFLAQKYGMKEIQRAKEFILNNEIPIYMAHRIDKQEFPCITISIGGSQEDVSLATLGDQSVVVETFEPGEIDRPIKFIVAPFDAQYDSVTGIVKVPEGTENSQFISKGMIAVDPDTGDGYVISEVLSDGFVIDPGADIDSKLGIVPQYAVYRARREGIRSQESYNIGLHVHGDPSTLIFLYGTVKYALWRYKEGLLEANNFQLSRLSSSDFIKNEAFMKENVYSRWITISGQIEESWVKTPFRVFEALDYKGSASSSGLTQGIRIISNSEPKQEEDDLWIAIKEDEES